MATGAACMWRALRVEHTWHVKVMFTLSCCTHGASAQQACPGFPHSARGIAATDVARASICSTSTAARHLVIAAYKAWQPFRTGLCSELPFRTSICCMRSQRWSHMSFSKHMRGMLLLILLSSVLLHEQVREGLLLLHGSWPQRSSHLLASK